MGEKQVTDQKIIRSMWLRFAFLSLGFLISLPWFYYLIPRMPTLFDMLVEGTTQETRVSPVTITQIVLIVMVVLDAIVPIVCFGTIFYQGFHFVAYHRSRALRLAAHALWLKTAAPMLPGLIVLWLIPSGEPSSSPDLWGILTNPQMGFWLYSPIIALITLAIARREQVRLSRQGVEVTAE